MDFREFSLKYLMMYFVFQKFKTKRNILVITIKNSKFKNKLDFR